MADKKNYSVGKDRPPTANRFKRGQSGNPEGRPKGSRNRNTIIRKVLSQVVTGDLDGRKKKITVTEASLFRLAQMAMKGDIRAIHTILALWKESEDAMAAEREAKYPFSETDHQMIEDIYARMKACEE